MVVSLELHSDSFDPDFRPLFHGTMITFTSFPKPKDSFSYAPQKFSTGGENDMDIDLYEDDDEGEDFDSGTKLTCPGEPITSSHAYMRCVSSLRVLVAEVVLKFNPSVVVMGLLSIRRP